MSHRNLRKSMDFKVGDYVLLTGKEGYIRYIGERLHQYGTWYGIELIIGNGSMSGTEHGKRYFFSKFNKGIFVRVSDIKCKLSNLKNKHKKQSNLRNRNGRRSRDKSSLKSPQYSRLKSPTQKHKMSRSISPLSKSDKNNTQIRTKSLRLKSHKSNHERSHPRSKSQANMGKNKFKPRNRNNSKKSKFVSADGTVQPNPRRLRLKNSKSIGHLKENVSANVNNKLKLKNNKSEMKKRRNKHSNIKPSTALRQKKRLSNQFSKNGKKRTKKQKKEYKYSNSPKPKSKKTNKSTPNLNLKTHTMSKSVGGANNGKKNMFDLEAILDKNNNLKPSKNKKLKLKNGSKSHANIAVKSKKRKRKSKNGTKKELTEKLVTKPVRKKSKKKVVRNRSVSPARNWEYRKRDNKIDLDKDIEIIALKTDSDKSAINARKYKKRAHSANALVFSTRKRHGWDIENIDNFEIGIGESESTNKSWHCGRCDRENEIDFKFCPNCGDKRPLQFQKEINLYDLELDLRQGSESEEMDQSQSDSPESDLFRFVRDEETEMNEILSEMKSEHNIKMEQIQRETEELKGLKKEDFIKTFDSLAINIESNYEMNGMAHTKSNSSSTQTVIVHEDNPKKVAKVKKSNTFSIKNWILSPKSIGKSKNNNSHKNNENYDSVLKSMGISNKFNENSINMGQTEESISYSDISYAYSIGARDNNNDRLMNSKSTAKFKETLDLIPDTPRSAYEDTNGVHLRTFNEFVKESNEGSNESTDDLSDGMRNKKNKRRKKKPKSMRRKSKKKKKRPTEI